MKAITIFWFRRDLRLTDNTGLYYALSDWGPVLPVFIFDEDILEELNNKTDKRVSFIYAQVKALRQKLQSYGSTLWTEYGQPEKVFARLFEKFPVKRVITNHDYEPYAQERDHTIEKMCREKGVLFRTFKDQVVYEKNEVLKKDGTPYTVFTPYMKAWKKQFMGEALPQFPSENYLDKLYKLTGAPLPTPESMGFARAEVPVPDPSPPVQVLRNYAEKRDFPALEGTSRLSVHLRFGTVSIRHWVKKAAQESEIFLNELIWREFYMMILWHFPHVENHSFKPKYDWIAWRNNEQEFEAWKNGQTGYPIVDAGMRELNQTGYMHNRLRMVTASFLTKHLLTDWRWGERYFAEKLLDYELSSNNGGWQWAAGSGCDAAPYFRVFNPLLQTQKFDPQHAYIRKWVPEYQELDYPRPIVEHKYARERALQAYKEALQNE